MATFAPTGTVRIGRVPFDNSYKHVMSHTSASAQASYFSGVCNKSLSKSSYTYVRLSNSIKVPFNAEKLYTYNYVMYQNSNYGSKWFYAFIVDIQYINENTTELMLELDIWNTWLFNWTLERCFVEREHVSNDAIGSHTNPEPEIPLRQKVQSRQTQNLGDNMTVIVQSAASPGQTAGNILATGELIASPVEGGVFGGVFNGCEYRATDLLNASAGGDLKRYLENMQRSGAGDSIAAVYMVPKVFVRGGSFSNMNGVLEQSISPSSAGIGFAINRPSKLDGYTPKNNKLFVYPYTFARISDNNGASADLLFEWGGGDLGINIDGSMEPSGECFVYPSNYAGVSMNYTAGISFSASVQCSWPFSSYKNWAAQNSLSNALTFGINAALFLLPAAKGAAAAAKTLGSGARWLGKRGAQANADRVAASIARTAGRRATDVDGVGAASMGAGALGMANLIGTYSVQSRQPDTVRGNATGNGIYATDKLAVNGDVIVPLAEYARIVDDFFSMFGYQVDRMKKPNITGRPSWNYVKTSNACNRGNVPADDMAAINAIFDSGVTIWHTGDIGNYSLNNQL